MPQFYHFIHIQNSNLIFVFRRQCRASGKSRKDMLPMANVKLMLRLLRNR